MTIYYLPGNVFQRFLGSTLNVSCISVGSYDYVEVILII